MAELLDLAARRLGGMVLAASDEFFAPKESLLLPDPPVFDPHRYTDRGKAMDGWETRRRRDAGHDWCLVRLGVPGVLRLLEVDTTHFDGNEPVACSVEGCEADPLADVAALTDPETRWTELLPRSPVRGDARNTFPLEAGQRVTHLRFHIYPDGGVARLRARGEALPDLRQVAGPDGWLDLAAATSGGAVRAASDERFSSRHNVVMVGDARDMGDGWETRRRRGDGHDWVLLALATAGHAHRVEVDTTHFKGNHPAACAVEGCWLADGVDATVETLATADWRELVPSAPLGPHWRHRFDTVDRDAVTHVRLRLHPDGGIARVRLIGQPSDDGWRRAGLRLLNALEPARAETELRSCCASSGWAEAMVATRPFADFDELLAAADRVADDLSPEDWREAFAAHPRIGERIGAGDRTGGWSRGEQAGVADADDAILQALVDGNRAYEERFGHVFLISAAGKSAEEMLAALRERMDHDPDTELQVAAEQQRAITRLRLDMLMKPAPQAAKR